MLRSQYKQMKKGLDACQLPNYRIAVAELEMMISQP